jgi:hypothetical protein
MLPDTHSGLNLQLDVSSRLGKTCPMIVDSAGVLRRVDALTNGNMGNRGNATAIA